MTPRPYRIADLLVIAGCAILFLTIAGLIATNWVDRQISATDIVAAAICGSIFGLAAVQIQRRRGSSNPKDVSDD